MKLVENTGVNIRVKCFKAFRSELLKTSIGILTGRSQQNSRKIYRVKLN
jgi:hypothetical protein